MDALSPTAIAGSAVILGGVGLFFAALIAVTNRKFKVWEDPRIDVVAGMLPGANCGAWGQPGCRAFAELLVAGRVPPAGCNVMSDERIAEVAQLLGVAAGEVNRLLA